ncbi:MAG: DUF4198 domain-containing protein [Desulfovibrionaceae bacterium]
MLRALPVLAFLALSLCIAPSSAMCHEFLLKPVQVQVSPNAEVPFSVVSAHVFMVSEEMEPLDKVSARLFQGNTVTDVELVANPTLMTLDGRIQPAGKGTAILAGHRRPMIWTKTTRGWKQGSKKGLAGVVSSGNYEKFCKTLVTVGESDDGYRRVVGHKLEIVPGSDPSRLEVGDEFEVQVLLDGKPASPGMVLATYDGFSDQPNTYAYFTEAYGEGLCKVKITHPGLWMIRVQETADQPTDDYDKHVMRAVLMFEVR